MVGRIAPAAQKLNLPRQRKLRLCVRSRQWLQRWKRRQQNGFLLQWRWKSLKRHQWKLTSRPRQPLLSCHAHRARSKSWLTHSMFGPSCSCASWTQARLSTTRTTKPTRASWKVSRIWGQQLWLFTTRKKRRSRFKRLTLRLSESKTQDQTGGRTSHGKRGTPLR